MVGLLTEEIARTLVGRVAETNELFVVHNFLYYAEILISGSRGSEIMILKMLYLVSFVNERYL